jgi:hypothetical protein
VESAPVTTPLPPFCEGWWKVIEAQGLPGAVEGNVVQVHRVEKRWVFFKPPVGQIGTAMVADTLDRYEDDRVVVTSAKDALRLVLVPSTGVRDEPAGPADDPRVPVILGGAPCPRCEAAVREGLESCPGCGAAIPMDATEWMPWGASEPWIKLTRREKILLVPPLGIIAAGGALIGLLMAGSALGVLSAEAELLGWLATFLIMGGFALLFLGLAGLGILWLLERVGKAVGLIVDEEAPDDVVPAGPTGPSWHVVFPGCRHLVQLEYPGHQPEWVWCDGSPVPLEWPADDGPGPFTFDDHDAALRLETHLDAAGAVGIALGALSNSPQMPDYRWRLVVTPSISARHSGSPAGAGQRASGSPARRGRRSRRGTRPRLAGCR